MRVAYVVKRYPRHSETFVVNEILAHERAGLEIEIFALRPTNDTHFQDMISAVRAPVNYLHFGGIKATTLWEGIQAAANEVPGCLERFDAAFGMPAGEVCQAMHLAAALRRRGIAHLHAHFASSAARVACLAARIADVSFTFTAHAKDIFHEEVSHDELRSLARAAKRVITVSDFNVDYLVAQLGIPAERILRLYNGLPVGEIPFRPRPRQNSILGVGRLVEKKGFRDLIAACALLRDEGVKAPCSIIGAGELEFELRSQIATLGLEDSVVLTGAQPRSLVADAMARAGVFVAPCVVARDGNRDGLPTVLLEAMASGLPCVSTEVTGIPEVLRHDDTGLIAKQSDPRSLARAIRRVLERPDEAAVLAHNARTRVERDFDIDRNAAILRGEFERASVA